MWKGIACVVVFVGFVWRTGGLRCLQCVDTATDGSCMHDYKGLVNASQGIYKNGSKSYVKQCHDGIHYGKPQNYCVIEEFYLGGELKSFIRDCSDGANFSFTGNKPEDTPAKLRTIAADNFTTCVYVMNANAHICVTLCEGEDFCNAPLPPNDTCKYDPNATCAGSPGPLFPGPGPFGPLVDRVLGRGYLIPLVVAAILGVRILG